jgi:23S rRNA pseudouridine1911/1915/1917 synthase
MNSEILTVEQTLPRLRLDKFLAGKFPARSRGAFQRLIEAGDILVNGRPTKPTHHPRAGERIEIRWPEARPDPAQPEAIPLEILFEDADLLVLNKPPGLVVHPAAGHAAGTLVNALLHHCAGGLSGIGGVARPGIVHRLDKETSGCLVVAKNDATHLALCAQFSARKVEKIYHAILCGEMAKREGEIDAAIARHAVQRKKMTVVRSGGRAALTTYRVLEPLAGAMLVEARIHTGRTHQIRVHFQHLGHPLVGDMTYGPRPSARLAAAGGIGARRQMLHARRLAFCHPRTGRTLVIEAPWPDDFMEALRCLRR